MSDTQRIEDLERQLRQSANFAEQQDATLAEIMKRSSRSSTLDLMSARRTLVEIYEIAKKARGFAD